MIRIHTKDGVTTTIDLRDESQARSLLSSLARDDFQRSITAVTSSQTHTGSNRCASCGAKVFVRTANQLTVSLPVGENRVHFQAERLESDRIKGERLTLFAGDVRLTAMSHSSQPSARVSMVRIGKRIVGAK
jgi:hypothetical protein